MFLTVQFDIHWLWHKSAYPMALVATVNMGVCLPS